MHNRAPAHPTQLTVTIRLALILTLVPLVAAAADAPPPAPPRLDKAPKLKRFVEATPPEALAARGHAEVILTFDVDETGKVQNVTVTQPAGDGFDEAAIAAVQQFEFEPGESGGKPVPVRITYKYKFLFKPPPPPPPPEPQAPPRVETVPLSGVVRSRGERVAQPGVRVLIDDGALATTTDADGRFHFAEVPVGEHVVKLRGGEVLPAESPVHLQAGKGLDVTYYVAIRNRYVSTVRGQRLVQETVEHTLSGDEVRRIPGTQGDTIKAVQNLPGVARAPFGGGLLVVWGSSPFDTRTYVDGIFIPTNFHFAGLRSTVNSEMVQSVRFMPGGYGADYGRGMGGVIEVESRRPRTDGYHGFAQLDALDASIMFEGKLPKNVSIALALRRSTMDAWLPYLTPNDFQVTPTYYDYQAKLHWKASKKDDLDVFIFGSDDQLRLSARRPDPALAGQFDSHIYYHRLVLRYTRKLGRGGYVAITPSLGYDQPLQFAGGFGTDNLHVDAHTLEYTLRAVARVPVTSFLRLDAGLDFEGNRWEISARAPVRGIPREGDSGGFGGGGFIENRVTLLTNHVAPFVGADFQLWDKRLQITPQLRLDTYTFTGYQGTPDHYVAAHVNLEPRLQLRVRLTSWMWLKAAIGLYHQPGDPVAYMRGFGNPTGLIPQRSTHYVLGFDFKPTQTLSIQVQGFYKELRNLIVRGETPLEPILLNDGLGRVYGGELLVRQELWRNFFGWVTYTALRSERRDHPGEPWRVFQFDQTHILTLIASYKLPRGFQIGARFRYVTGNPQTPILPEYSYFDANAGLYRPVYGPQYSTRVDDFHQLDVRFDKTFTFKLWKLSIYLDVQNVYNYQSAEGYRYNYNYTQRQVIAGLPIVPSLGVRGEF